MTAILVVLGFLALGCAVVAWGTRHAWAPPMTPLRQPSRSARVTRGVAASIVADAPLATPATADPFADAPMMEPAAAAVPATIPVFAPPLTAFATRPTSDPFAHAPSMAPPTFAEPFFAGAAPTASDTRH